MKQNLSRAGRRAFMRSAAGAAATGAAAPMMLNLAAVGTAAAADATDYKALVCVFLNGGNDHYNTIVPYDQASYNQYAQARNELAISRGELAATVLNPVGGSPDGREFALAPQMPNLRQLWTEQKMSVLLNVGPLIVPTSKADYDQRAVPLPPKLFSHNDQQSVWQSLAPEGATTGWGGRMADIFTGANQNEIFTSISLSGNAVLLSGDRVTQYQMSANGPVELNARQYDVYRHRPVSTAIEQLLTTNSTNNQLTQINRDTAVRSLSATQTLSTALSSAGDPSTQVAGSGLEEQLQMVARMLAARDQIGMKRQIFYVQMNGFDLHAGLNATHPQQLAAVDQAIANFYRTTETLGVADKVTTFTASDFGRTLSSNGDGSDHGWGGHHMIVGGAVRGQQFYGQAPELADDGPDDVGRGRLLPTISVDQYSATLGAWFGVNNTELNDIFSGLSAFDQRDLGFMQD
ncbi:MAG: DUF1501 domain-containing protein [Burkholderiaceae bacterium]